MRRELSNGSLLCFADVRGGSALFGARESREGKRKKKERSHRGTCIKEIIISMSSICARVRARATWPRDPAS